MLCESIWASVGTAADWDSRSGMQEQWCEIDDENWSVCCLKRIKLFAVVYAVMCLLSQCCYKRLR